MSQNLVVNGVTYRGVDSIEMQNDQGETVPYFTDAVRYIEPADDDIPKVYFTGTLPTSKTEEGERLTMHYISKTADFIYPVTLNVQGSSSASYPKKNFTLKPYKDSSYEKKQKLVFKNWGELNKFVLKAHWIDHSHVRNVGTAKIWSKIVKSRADYDSLPEELRNAPNHGATDGFTCKVFCNGIYQGLYEWIVPKDKLFGQNDDIATHSIMNSEVNNQPTCAFATTSPAMNGNWSEELHDSLSSDISTSFANLIKFVAGSTDEAFVANAEKYFDVQSVIDYNIFARIFCIVDNLCRNQIFFTYDGVKWYEGVWDLDAVLGLPPTTREFFAYNTEFQNGYIAYKDYGVTNLLYQRVETLFSARFKARYEELRSGVLSIENILDVYERLTDVITTYDGLLAEDYASTTGGGEFTGIPYTSQNNIQQIRNFVAQRIPYMDEVIATVHVPCAGISLNTNTLTFTEESTQTISATVTPTECTDPIVWISANPEIAHITVDGAECTVHAIANGSTTVTVSCGEYSAVCSVVVSGLDMPNGYTRLDYINSSGNSYINTGVLATQDTSAIFKVRPLAYSYYGHILSGNKFFFPCIRTKQNPVGEGVFVKRAGKDTIETWILDVRVDAVVTAFMDGNTYTINDKVSQPCPCGSDNETVPLHIGSFGGDPGKYGMNCRIYYVKIYENGVLIRDYIPCKNQVGEVGLYERVNGVFSSSGNENKFTEPTE